ncbi:methyl-accepting chemotaxis protein [Pseudoalteromonas sp. R3]|jgi:methyl-accepting chemotaxis protein|uniref:methyl-accepting chemotaxis protein n=1 Tax=Pseudoalteromonas sp. R3 TaxID=1709477 RepID=UPI0006B4CC1F|nr:methyl-accepting chemotaxis protein [Pseudoalteromonas sp. R3]AZZ99888.1 methyl-accepting chemotaxis protein [Pseudoalteromonas sp. R3]
MTISQKLRLAFIVAIVSPILIIAVLIVSQTRQLALDKFVEMSGREALQVDNGIGMFFDEIAKNVEFLATNPKLTGAQSEVQIYTEKGTATQLNSRSGSETEQAAYDLFERFGDTHPGIAYIYFGNTEGGYIQWPQGEVSANYDPRPRPWYRSGQAANGKTVMTDAYYWAPDDMAIVSTVRSVRSNGREIGVTGMDVSLQGLTKIIREVKLGETGYLMLVEDTGKILVDAKHSDYRFKDVNEVDNGLYRTVASNQSGLYEIQIDDTDYFASIYTSKKLGWKFIAFVEQGEVMAAANAMTWTLVILSVVLVALFVVLANYIANVLSGPIVEVSDGLTVISQGGGDLTQRLEVDSKDETGKLADSFNSFLDLIAQLVMDINACAQQLNQTACATATESEELTSSTAQQQQALEMAATAINEMAATANEVASSCANAADLATQTQQASELGQSVMTEAVDSVAALSEVIKRATSDINQLDSESENIMSILSVIRGIAEQTNLLALNAAIEAARAGEHGRGFAVVADEVRALSQRTSESTEEIASQLDKLRKMTEGVSQDMRSSLTRTDKTVELTGSAQSQFSEITQSIQTISDLNTQIATAAEEQQHVAEDINRNVIEIKHAADSVSDVANNTSENGDKMQRLSEQLTKLVGQFRV